MGDGRRNRDFSEFKKRKKNTNKQKKLAAKPPVQKDGGLDNKSGHHSKKSWPHSNQSTKQQDRLHH